MSRPVDQIIAQAQKDHEAGQFAQAEAGYRQALRQSPEDITALHLLGLLLHQTGRTGEGLGLLERSVMGKGAPPEFFGNFGAVLMAVENVAGAARAFAHGVALRPTDAGLLNNLAAAVGREGRFDEAIEIAQRAMALRPGWADAAFNLAQSLKGRAKQLHFEGSLSRAVELYRRAVSLRGEDVEARSALAVALAESDELAEARREAEHAVQMIPANSEALWTLGYVMEAQGELERARNEYRAVIEDEAAIDWVRDSVSMNPAHLGTLLGVGQALARGEDFPASAAWALGARLMSLHYRDNIDRERLFEEHRRVGRLYERRAALPAVAVDRTPARRLRVGYVSADFWSHSVGMFVESLLAEHDRAAVEVFCFSNRAGGDEVTARLRGYAVTWREIAGLPDEIVAAMVRQDGIDILVDLSGHTSGNRLGVFALKPAPVAVTYLGYPDTTGLARIDYRLTDAEADPEGDERHTERLVRLPRTAWCFRAPADSPAVRALPAEKGGPVTFGSFNNVQKLNERTAALWARVMKQVPGSRLLLKSRGLEEPSRQRKIVAMFERFGIESSRIEMLAQVPSAHYALYERVDVGLDPFPYHGTTTTCEAMWMGVPVVTLAGDRHSSRVGVSLLSSVGLEELVARTDEEFVKIAVDLASDRARLTALRRSLRDRMRGSPLMDAKGFARDVESAYREMWRGFVGSESGDRRLASEAHRRAGRDLLSRGWGDDALMELRRAIEFDPTNLAAQADLAGALGEMNRLTEAIEVGARALATDPVNNSATTTLAALYTLVGRASEGIALMTRMLRERPPRDEPVAANAMSSLIMMRHYDQASTPEQIFEEELRFGRAFDRDVHLWRRRERKPGERLRVGYVSADFRAHPVGKFIEPVLEAHDRERFEVFCYSSAALDDAVTARLKAHAADWRDIRGSSSVDAARVIADDEIDVLVDLGGHTAGNRLTVFGWKPAPVQVTYLGFPSSTGMRSMGWRISDAWADPPGMTERYHTEKLLRLAEAFYCYRPHDEAPEVGELPAPANGFVTMGSMNAFRKVTPAMIEVWAGILREVPTARLLIVGSGDASADQRVRQSLGDAGERVEILGRMSRAEYLRLYQRVDISLDPYPFNGHTTSCDSLWMGVPVVTLAGKTAASRAGVSVLNNVGLPEMVGETREQYRAIAVELARDADRLRELRRTLRERMARSVICDAKRVTGRLEEAYLEMSRAAGAG